MSYFDDNEMRIIGSGAPYRRAKRNYNHECHVNTCNVQTPPIYLMCNRHWKMVPKKLQHDVWNNYREGQCDDKQPSRGWFDAADAAIKYVLALENKQRRKPITKEKEMKMEIAVLAGAESKQFLVDLTKIVERMEAAIGKTPAVTKTSPKADPVEETEESDFAPAPKKKAKAPSFEDQADEAPPKAKKAAAPVEDETDENDFMTPPKKATKAKKLTVDDVNDACKAKALAEGGGKVGRSKVLAILKKNFQTESVSELTPDQYAEAIEALEV